MLIILTALYLLCMLYNTNFVITKHKINLLLNIEKYLSKSRRTEIFVNVARNFSLLGLV